jgi:hypothetical protein
MQIFVNIKSDHLRFFRELKRVPGNKKVKQRKMWSFHLRDCCHDQLL